MMTPLLFGRAFSRRRYTGQGSTACHHVFGVLRQFPRFVARDQSAQQQIAVAAEGLVFFDAELILLMFALQQIFFNHDAIPEFFTFPYLTAKFAIGNS